MQEDGDDVPFVGQGSNRSHCRFATRRGIKAAGEHPVHLRDRAVVRTHAADTAS